MLIFLYSPLLMPVLACYWSLSWSICTRPWVHSSNLFFCCDGKEGGYSFNWLSLFTKAAHMLQAPILLFKNRIHRFINLDRIINSKTADNHVEAMESAVIFESLTQLNTSRQAFLSCLHFRRGVAESVWGIPTIQLTPRAQQHCPATSYLYYISVDIELQT